ncbi:MAG: AMP-dependent synthetase/ligase [Oligoflexus sp.]
MDQSLNLPQTFFKNATRHTSERAFYYCRTRDRRWVDMTWKKYQEDVVSLASWLHETGVQKGDRVALISANRPEWLIADMAIMSIGAVSVPIYATSSHADIEYILEHSGAKILLVDDLERIEFLKSYSIDRIVCFDRANRNLAQTFQAPLSFLSEIRRKRLKLDHLPFDLADDDQATIIYTSGTTGQPKGVMHSHGNLKAALPVIERYLKRDDGQPDRFFSFLPLSHVAELTLVFMGSVVKGSEVAFARSIDTLGEDLVRCRPTILLCVPRLWEKIYERINAGLITASPLKRGLFELAQNLGEMSRIDGDRVYKTQDKFPLFSKVSDVLVGKKLKAKLGLDRCRLLLTGAAPTRPEILRFFGSFGLVIREVYGLTENLCLGVLNDPDLSVMGSCGKAFRGNKVKIAEDQEILFKAPWNFQGYYKNPEASKEAYTEDGWLKTGDLGKLDEESRLTIIGRKKELLKTSGGKYVAPVPIEDRLKAWSVIRDAMVVGDERKYCVALISLDSEATNGKDSKQIKAEIKSHLKKINEPLASFETIKRVGVMKDGFSVENGSLTPTLKVKRGVVAKQKGDFIERLYSSEDVVIYEG